MNVGFGKNLHRIAIAFCGVMLVVFITVAWFAARTKSPTYDEPYHALSSWLQLRFMDFRFDNEDPPLWQYWASLPNGRDAITADFQNPQWIEMPQHLVRQWYWGVVTLYRTAGNNPVQLITRCRAMMLSLAMLLGFLVCYWSWRIAGPTAAMVAGTFFCLDPNFLAHSALMKNDVAFALSMFGLAMALWKAGRELNLESIGWVALLSVVTLSVKFSGFVAILLVPTLLVIRALVPTAWPAFGRTLSSRFSRLILAAVLTLGIAAISYGGIWAVYGFRFEPTREKGVSLNLVELTDKVRKNEMTVEYHGNVPTGTPTTTHLTLPAQLAMLANDHHLFPQAFIAGFLFTYSNAMVRSSYLLGTIAPTGWWWYFPFAILVKTPIATLAAAGFAFVIVMRAVRQKKFADPAKAWTVICLAVPVIVFLGSAMVSNLNIGLRHILGIYPFVFVAVGCTAASLWKTDSQKIKITFIGLGLLLAIESLSVYPDYIPYFNVVAANLPGGKLNLLGDSNLDWGQDLISLAQWQHEHPGEKLYLSYFGYADPAYYGIKYIPMPGGYFYDPPKHSWVDPYSRSVVAISGCNLQGILLDPELRDYYNQWKARKPLAVLGDSIYLYENDPLKNLQQSQHRSH